MDGIGVNQESTDEAVCARRVAVEFTGESTKAGIPYPQQQVEALGLQPVPPGIF